MTKKPEDIAVEAATAVLPFFCLNGRYSIAPGNSIENLGNDIGCMMESCVAVLQTVIEGISDKGSAMSASADRDVPRLLYGVLFQMNMIGNMNEAICSLAVKGEQST